MKKVVALGELLIDFTCIGTDDRGYPTMAAHPGGAPANFLATLAKYGVHTALLGKVGADTFGKLLTRTLEEARIHTGGIVMAEDVFTTLAFVTLDERGDREFSFARKPGADTCLTFREVDLELIRTADVFHFGSLSLTHEPARTATKQAVAFAKAQGKRISYDPNLRRPLWADPEEAREQLLWGVNQADILKISDEEVRFLFGLDPREGARYILEHCSPRLIFVTCGAQGCWYCNPRALGHVPALSGLPVADTTGAGDIFGGSALWQLLQLDADPAQLTGPQLRQITAFACTAASLSTTRPGGIPSIPTLSEILPHLPNP